MMASPAPLESETAKALCFLLTTLVPFAAAGLALMNAGLCRSRNAAYSMLSALCVAAAAVLAYFAIGFSFQGYPGGAAYAITIGARDWRWISAERLFLRGLEFDGSAAPLYALFGTFGVGVAATIPLGGGADRWRLGASCLSTAVLAGWTYPLFAHWVWGGGWLAQLGPNYGIGRGLVDCGGAGAIHMVGGLTALAIAWVLGPRRGKYTREGMPAAIPGHNAVLVLFGCFLAWVGWLGLDCAGAMLFAGAEVGRVPLAALNTTLSAASAALTSAGITRARFGKVDASLCANGWVAGLVGASAGCALIRPAAAVMVGIVGGALAIYSIEWLELYFSVDDPGGAISVHAVGGLWSLMAAGLLAANPVEGQWLAQLVGVATLIGFVLPLTFGLNSLLNRVYPVRVAPEAERQGLDLHELGAGAYPDFMSHTDDSWLR
jgi:Amt family ammonium transporter